MNNDSLSVLTGLKSKGIFIDIDGSGENLKLKGKVQELSDADKKLLVENKREIIQFLSDRRKIEGTSENLVIPRSPAREYYPLSFTQKAIWLLSQFDEGNIAYNMPGSYILEGDLNVRVFEEAFNTVADRHESLRTIFRENEQGEVSQYILSPGAVRLHIKDADRPTSDAAVQEIVQGDFSKPFALDREPPLRATLLRCENKKWVFYYVLHHIAADGLSIRIFIRQLQMIYNLLAADRQVNLPEPPIQYRDFALWQQASITSGVYADSRRFWMQKLGGAIERLELPFDFQRPLGRTYHGAVENVSIPPVLFTKLEAYNRSRSCSMFMSLMGILNILLYRYTGQKDILIGVPFAGRNIGGIEDQIGLFINTLVFRTAISPSMSGETVVASLKEQTLSVHRHQHYPFDHLVEDLNIAQDQNRNPFFDVMMVLQGGDAGEKLHGFHNVQARQVDLARERKSKFDLTFNFLQLDDGLGLAIQYNADLFASSTIQQMGNHLTRLMEQFLKDPGRAIGQLDYLEEQEQARLLTLSTGAAHSADTHTVVTLFEREVHRNPSSVALVFGQKRYTYDEVNREADRLSFFLRCKGIATGDFVVFRMRRSHLPLIAILGILKSGAAFVAIDPDAPEERVRQILSEVQPKMVLREADVLDVMETAAEPGDMTFPADAQDLAYAIFTSGSTGRPKGVLVEHLSLATYISAISREYALSADDHVLLLANFTFDASIEQVFIALCNGACLYVMPEHPTPEMIADFIGENSITHLHTVPTLLGQLPWRNNFKLRRIVSAGEPCPADLRSRFPANIDFYNKYGPTEATISACLYRHSTNDDLRLHTNTVPIGMPLKGYTVVLLDEFGQLVPPGVTGEIFIGGTCVARGYLNDEALTRRNFIRLDSFPGMRFYKTGDLGKRLSDGNILYLRRNDDQFKIRGNRIEPAEIESALQQLPNVRAAAVAKWRLNHEDQLIAYVVSDEALSSAALRQGLQQKLPAYMLPDDYMQLRELPVMPNGKIDRKNLPAPSNKASTGNDYEAPSNKTEEQLADVWRSILGREQIGRNDDFFLLGGNSLKCMRVATRIQQVFNVRVSLKQLFECHILNQQATLIRSLKTSAFTPIEPASPKPGYVLSSSQKRLWVLNQFEEGRTSYNIFGVYSVSGTVDFNRLDSAFKRLVGRHESLRTVFRTDPQTDVVQVILDPSDVPAILQLHHVDSLNNDSALRSIVKDYQNHVFDLSKGPLIRAGLVTGKDREHFLVYTLHHIISDAWSMQIMMQELMMFYHSPDVSSASLLPPLAVQYKDYAEWQQKSVDSGELMESREFWMQQLGGDLPVLELPLDHPRRHVRSADGARLRVAIPRDVSQSLKNISDKQGATLFMTLLSAIKILLYKYTGQDDIIVGTPVAGRIRPELEGQLGFFVNTLPLRNSIKPDQTFLELLSSIRANTLMAFEHQGYPFDQMVEDLKVSRSSSRNVLFDVMVAYQNVEAYGNQAHSVDDAGFTIRDANIVESNVSKFDLSFEFGNEGDDLILQIEYSSDLFLRDSIGRLAGHFLTVLQSISQQPSAKVAAIEFVTKEEKATLLEAFNSTDHWFDQSKTLVDHFRDQAAATPDHIALICGAARLTYHELHVITNQLANYLREKYIVSPDDIIGVKLPRNEWAVISILGILKAGAAYMPIDPLHPHERIKAILDKSRAIAVIDEDELNIFSEMADRYSPECAYRPQSSHLAYVIFTSGSTGAPKGAMIEHLGMLNHLIEMKETLSMDEHTRICQNALYTFDISVWQMLNAFICGGTTVMYDYDLILDPRQFLQQVIDDGITILQVVPSYLQEILECSVKDGVYDVRKIRYLLVTGEAVSPNLIRQWFGLYPGQRVVNAYGPAEASDDVTLHVMDHFNGQSNVPVGRPIRNMKIHILNVDDQLQPIGQYGEICVSGIGVGRGYLNDPEKTTQKFVADPFTAGGGRMYKTGDIGRWLADGTIEFVGRRDHQVKLRGFRIELGDIENALLGHPAVKEAVVVMKETSSGEKALAAYFATSGDIVQEGAMADHLRKQIPSYMVPAYFCQLDQLPRNTNGKIDRKLLPDIAGRDRQTVLEPETDTEKHICAIWRQILDREVIGVQDNFFELGGHSLKVIKVISMIHEKLNVRIGLEFFFGNPDIRSLARYVDAASTIKNKTVESEDTLLF